MPECDVLMTLRKIPAFSTYASKLCHFMQKTYKLLIQHEIQSVRSDLQTQRQHVKPML